MLFELTMRRVGVGGVLAGRFRIESVIGAGGMGLVLAAHHIALDSKVALKLMLPGIAARPDLVKRFLREGRTAARLESEHVTRVLEVGTLDDGAPYIVMELLEGMDLATLLRTSGRLPIGAAAALVQQASAAVAEAHALGIVHRDLKPANLFITRRPDGSPLLKVLDLGICKLEDADGERLTTSSAELMGTPAYMAPEQRRSASLADPRADSWSLGVILYELVSGQLPFRVQDVAGMGTCPPVHATSVPPGFEAVIGRCLLNDPAARFQSASEVVAALAPFALASSIPPVVSLAAHVVEPTQVAPVPLRRRRRLLVAALLALLPAMLTIGLGRGERSTDRTAAPPAPVVVGKAESPTPVARDPAPPAVAEVPAPAAHIRTPPPTAAKRRRQPTRPAPTASVAPASTPPEPPASAYDPYADPD